MNKILIFLAFFVTLTGNVRASGDGDGGDGAGGGDGGGAGKQIPQYEKCFTFGRALLNRVNDEKISETDALKIARANATILYPGKTDLWEPIVADAVKYAYSLSLATARSQVGTQLTGDCAQADAVLKSKDRWGDNQGWISRVEKVPAKKK